LSNIKSGIPSRVKYRLFRAVSLPNTQKYVREWRWSVNFRWRDAHLAKFTAKRIYKHYKRGKPTIISNIPRFYNLSSGVTNKQFSPTHRNVIIYKNLLVNHKISAYYNIFSSYGKRIIGGVSHRGVDNYKLLPNQKHY